ncbi:putative reverse transcriptase domain-containing protein, partial [Tanacetum coccineum]
LFFFQFISKDALDAMLENGPWFIPNNPLILKKWNLDVNLLKEDVGNVLVWVKLHDAPMTTFNKDGLSVIATKLAMIELRADVKLKDTVMVAMPKLVVEGFYICTIHIEYEWKPPRCSSCKVGLKVVVVSKEVKNSNSFDVLNSVEKDDNLGKKMMAGKGPSSKMTTKRDDNYDPYDDDLYESHDMSENIQAIYDELDITVRELESGTLQIHAKHSGILQMLSLKSFGTGNKRGVRSMLSS